MKTYLNKFTERMDKDKLITNYIIIITILFIISNILLRNLIISGFIYHIIMIVLTILNIRFLLKNKEKIKYKKIGILICSLIWIISKNFYGIILVLSTLITLTVIEYSKSLIIKVLAYIIALIISIVFILFLYLQIIVSSLFSYDDDAFDDSHYYCDNHYEAYVYSAGSIDSYHHSIGKHYDFIDLGVIIFISYKGDHEVSTEEYNKFIETHNCKRNGG